LINELKKRNILCLYESPLKAATFSVISSIFLREKKRKFSNSKREQVINDL